MTESTERVGAHELHPNFNLKNARRLIAALRNAVPEMVARERPMEINGSPATKGDLLNLRVDIACAEGQDPPKRVPVAYAQGTWASALKDRANHMHSCGTAACIAGFAWLLREKDRGSEVTVSEFMKAGGTSLRKHPHAMEDVLAEFLGVSIGAAKRMSAHTRVFFLHHSPQPRHAVAMLEWFMETGEVDWWRASGFVERGRRKRDWRGLRPWRRLEWTDSEIRMQADDRRSVDAARAARG